MAESVETGGKAFPPERKSAPCGPLREGLLRNRLPARIFRVDILPRERRIPPVRFPSPDKRVCTSGIVLGMKETCEEKL
jgi:hypothetical protein